MNKGNNIGDVLESNEVKAKVLRTIKELFRRDSYLLQTNVNERAITHRLGLYLEQEGFRIGGLVLDVDCEYNRYYGEPKKISEDSLVQPDIIVHKRGEDLYNYLVIEVKKTKSSTCDDNKDRLKLYEFVNEPRYNYRLGLRLTLPTGEDFAPEKYDKCKLEWFEKS